MKFTGRFFAILIPLLSTLAPRDAFPRMYPIDRTGAWVMMAGREAGGKEVCALLIEGRSVSGYQRSLRIAQYRGENTSLIKVADIARVRDTPLKGTLDFYFDDVKLTTNVGDDAMQFFSVRLSPELTKRLYQLFPAANSMRMVVPGDAPWQIDMDGAAAAFSSYDLCLHVPSWPSPPWPAPRQAIQ